MTPAERKKYEFDKPILSLYPAWLYAKFVAGGKMIRLSNLYGLFQLGAEIQELNDLLTNWEQKTIADVAVPCAQVIASLAAIFARKVIPLVAVQESAVNLMRAVMDMSKDFKENWNNSLNPAHVVRIQEHSMDLKYALANELRQLPTYIATEKGNLSIDKLVDGASMGYSKRTIDLLDDFIIFEIDEAGRCLAFGLFTSCGFHILRSVEVAIKGYIYAAKGSLPPINRRNWGEYITQLEGVGGSPELIDCIKILKTKRNPLMHPQDKLESDEAIDIFNLCNSTMNELIKDVSNKNLDEKIKDALAILPTL